MNDDQLERILGICMGLEVAVAHLATIMASKGVASRADIATSFQATAMSIPQDVKAGPMISVVLNRIAKTIQHAEQQLRESENEIRQILH